MFPSLLKTIHADMSVVPRLLYTGTKVVQNKCFVLEWKP